jgi:tetratricopeptide (TPR) repeat protein
MRIIPLIMKNILLPILIISLNWTLHAQDLNTLVEKGNQQYVKGEFEAAIKTYETVLDSGYEAAELYFNLGNAYFKSHKLTPAILNYERAALLSPNDEDIAYNLELARTYVIDKIDVLPQFFLKAWYTRIVRLLNSDSWAYGSIITFILFLLIFSLYLFIRSYRIKKIAFWFSLLLLFISIATFVFSYHDNKMTTSHDKAIVFSPSVTVKSSPDESGTDLFLIHEGTRVRIEDTLGIWTEIKLEDGNKGWLHSSDIRKI